MEDQVGKLERNLRCLDSYSEFQDFGGCFWWTHKIPIEVVSESVMSAAHAREVEQKNRARISQLEGESKEKEALQCCSIVGIMQSRVTQCFLGQKLKNPNKSPTRVYTSTH